MRIQLSLAYLATVLLFVTAGHANPNMNVPSAPSKLSDSVLDARGRFLTVTSSTNRNLLISIREGKKEHLFDVELKSVATNATILQGKINSFAGEGAAIGFVVQVGTKYSYHYLLNENGIDYINSTNWVLSPPIFENDGMPYRVVEVANREGDTLLITFRKDDGLTRESHWWRKETPELEERIYVNVCAVVTMAGTLYEVTGVRALTNRVGVIAR